VAAAPPRSLCRRSLPVVAAPGKLVGIDVAPTVAKEGSGMSGGRGGPATVASANPLYRNMSADSKIKLTAAGHSHGERRLQPHLLRPHPHTCPLPLESHATASAAPTHVPPSVGEPRDCFSRTHTRAPFHWRATRLRRPHPHTCPLPLESHATASAAPTLVPLPFESYVTACCRRVCRPSRRCCA